MIIVNGKEIYDSNQLYAYKTYLDYELSYPKTVKDSFLSCLGYFTDASDQNDQTKEGLKRRQKLFATSKTVQFKSKLNADIFNQDLYFINNCKVILYHRYTSNPCFRWILKSCRMMTILC